MKIKLHILYSVPKVSILLYTRPVSCSGVKDKSQDSNLSVVWVREVGAVHGNADGHGPAPNPRTETGRVLRALQHEARQAAVGSR